MASTGVSSSRSDSATCWEKYATESRGWTKTSPANGGITDASVLRSVDLPAPFEPSTESLVPNPMSKSNRCESGADLKFDLGKRYGLVGQNGAGKSTLLRVMQARAIPGWPTSCRSMLVEQEDIGDDRSALHCVIEAASTEISSLRAREAILTVSILFFYFLQAYPTRDYRCHTYRDRRKYPIA